MDQPASLSHGSFRLDLFLYPENICHPLSIYSPKLFWPPYFLVCHSISVVFVFLDGKSLLVLGQTGEIILVIQALPTQDFIQLWGFSEGEHTECYTGSLFPTVYNVVCLQLSSIPGLEDVKCEVANTSINSVMNGPISQASTDPQSTNVSPQSEVNVLKHEEVMVVSNGIFSGLALWFFKTISTCW